MVNKLLTSYIVVEQVRVHVVHPVIHNGRRHVLASHALKTRWRHNNLSSHQSVILIIKMTGLIKFLKKGGHWQSFFCIVRFHNTS